MGSWVRRVVIVAGVTALALGCVKAQAKTEPAMPVLLPPPPPPRAVEAYNDEPVPTVEPSPAEIALNSPPTPTAPKPPAQRSEVPPKPEPPRVEPERPAAMAAAQPPTLTLKPAPGSENATESSIRTLLSRAMRDLSNTDYKSLNTDGKAQYDTAKRFMQQAEEALRGGNLIFAGKLADKAATMAAVLVR